MRRYLLLAILFVAISAGITYSILIWEEPTPEITKPNQGGSEQQDNKPINLVTQTPTNPEEIEVELSVNRTWNKIIFERVYTYCNHTVIEELKQSSPLLNLSRKEFLGLYPGWMIKDESGGQLVLQMKINDFCPEDLKKRYVGEKDGFVAIFYGEPGMKEKLVKITDIPTAGFPVSLQEKLRQGIVSNSEDHLISFIDGLASFYWD